MKRDPFAPTPEDYKKFNGAEVEAKKKAAEVAAKAEVKKKGKK
ncbi:hypothetical protein [Candidatus Magnetobacterium casense]|nr:hypothetical protein [Candidatus Magnetobacterium casensis]